MRATTQLARLMKDYGAEHVFTLTGAPQEPLLTLKNELGVNIVLGHNERSVAFMADGYARQSGKPTFTFVQFGPGVTALAGGLSDAFWAHSPVVSLASALPTSQRHRFAYQEVDQLAMMAPVTKWCGQVPAAARAPDMLQRAVIEAMSGVPGPTHVEIPLDLMVSDIGDQPQIAASERHRQIPSARPIPESRDVEAAAKAICEAERPVFLVGAGIGMSGACPEFQALCERLAIPVLTTLAGKGVLADTHPQVIGVAGTYSRKCANDVLAEADLIVAIGTRLGAHPTVNYQHPQAGTKLVHIDLDPRIPGRNFPTVAALIGDARAALNALSAAISEKDAKKRAPARGKWLKSTQVRLVAWKEQFNKLAGIAMVEGRINPRHLMSVLDRFIGPDDALASDTGYSAGFAATMVDLKSAGRNFFRAYGSLGWGFPGAIGASLARKTGHVVCVTGDGGFCYHLTEIETALRVGARPIIVVLNNSRLGFEYTMQKVFFGGSTDATQQFRETNYAAIANAYGAHGERVEKPEEILPALRRSAASGKLAIVDVVTSPEVPAPYTGYEAVGAREI